MNPKLLVYLDYLLKNSAVPMRLNVDPQKLSPDEILEINKMVADGDLQVHRDTGDMFIAVAKYTISGRTSSINTM